MQYLYVQVMAMLSSYISSVENTGYRCKTVTQILAKQQRQDLDNFPATVGPEVKIDCEQKLAILFLDGSWLATLTFASQGISYTTKSSLHSKRAKIEARCSEDY
jgi:hypothetical protein